ncbi:hypothetical protein JCM14202_91 [Agrilactobacillus composti DSM 18527 = JCM 14202]|nr:hypothetical protein JCM14202_91 [Agrilactobacillus composti DSM 18527 = JCM 14202]
MLQRACTHAAGPYNYQDVDIDAMPYIRITHLVVPLEDLGFVKLLLPSKVT